MVALLCSTCLSLSEMTPQLVQVLLTFLESAAAQTVVKRQSLLPMLACKLLFRAFAGEPDWPIEFVQVVIYPGMFSEHVQHC